MDGVKENKQIVGALPVAHVEYVPLRVFAKRFRDALKQGDIGPQLIAAEIENIAIGWDRYKAEAEGRSFHEWLRAEVSGSRRRSWWKRLQEAVQGITKPVATRLHTRAVIYFWQTVPPSYQQAVLVEALGIARRQPVPVSLGQLLTVVEKIVPKSARIHRAAPACACCDILRAQIVKMGGKPKV